LARSPKLGPDTEATPPAPPEDSRQCWKTYNDGVNCP
jgi:hypothetical protein